MKKFLFIFTILALLFSCNNSNKRTTKLFHLIPEHSSLVIKINDIQSFKSDISNNDFINKLPSSIILKDINRQLENLKTDYPVLICVTNDSEKKVYSIITKYHDSLLTITKTDSLQIYSKIIDSIYIGSTSQIIINNLKYSENLIFESFSKSTNNNSSFSVFDNGESSNLGYLITSKDIISVENRISFDVNLSPNQITFNGFTIANDTLPQLLKTFKNTIPQENNIQHITPSNSNGFLSITFDDFEVFNKNKNSLDSLFNYDIFQTINEVGEIHFDTETAVVLKSIDASATKEALQDYQNEVSNFRTIPIFEFSNSEIFNIIFDSFIEHQFRSYYINLDDFFVFSNSIKQLQHIITNFQNGTTFANTNAFKDAMVSLSDESSLLRFVNPAKLKEVISLTTEKDVSNLNLNNYKTSAIQFVQDDGFIHINGVIKENKTRARQNSVSEEFNVILDANIIMQPHFVKNHRTKQKEIVVQDVNNHLYLISNSGKVLWKKKLNGAILGDIQQVDLYKNGRLQLAFATSKRIYIIDRNGNDVSPFPLKFNSEITQPLSIFDYDNNKNYRFLVTQDKFLLMYDRKAKNVNGFRYTNTGNKISTQPKHFRISNKDYIVFASGKKLMILNRQGKSRIEVKDNINFSDNPIYKYKNRFTTTSSTGELIQVNTKGAVSKQSLNLDKDHFIVTTDKTLVTLSENDLNIKQKTYELDFGNYTAPKIFYLYDKIYISLTDLQTQKIYLFDSQAKLLNNFPVYGNSIIDLDNIDADRNLEFVVKGESNSIVVYKKN